MTALQGKHVPQKLIEKRKANLSLSAEEEEESYLTLGDGDFSYSLDLAAYLSVCAHFQHVNLRIKTTGYDSLKSLKSKYRDVNAILRKLKGFHCVTSEDGSMEQEERGSLSLPAKKKTRTTTPGNQSPPSVISSAVDSTCLVKKQRLISISVEHNVNAIIFPLKLTSTSTTSRNGSHSQPSTTAAKSDNHNNIPSAFSCYPRVGYKHVIFNHPHLGTEDVKLHSHFLSHFFHSVVCHWLISTGGVLHLTLAHGQCQRWNAIALAKDQGLVLLRKCDFRPPPPRGKGHKSWYQQRRHQSGKSFKKRTEGSETLVFCRSEDEKHLRSLESSGKSYLLPWYTHSKLDTCVSEAVAPGDTADAKQFACPHCPKSFKEERSRKNHIKCVHKNLNDNSNACKATIQYECVVCKEEQNVIRTFSSRQALSYHVRAKHTGPNTYIKPDWAGSSASNSASTVNPCDNEREQTNNASESYSSENNPHFVRSNNSHHARNDDESSCSICGVQFMEGAFDWEAHKRQFCPDNQSRGNEIDLCECKHCQKVFSDRRALLQHENFCSKKHEKFKCEIVS